MSFSLPHMDHVMALRRVIAEVAGLRVACESMSTGAGPRVMAKVPDAIGPDNLTPFAVHDAMVSALGFVGQAGEMFAVAERDLRMALSRIGEGV